MEGPKTDNGYLQAQRSNHNTPIQMHSNSKNWDLIVIGAGPAGLTAGIYGARSGLDTLVLEMMMPGGTIAEAAVVENYPGFPEGISGPELAERLKHQCVKSGAELRIREKVEDVSLNNKKKRVITDNGEYASSAIIIATGSRRKRLGMPSEDRLRGKGISYCALCDGPLYRDKRVMVVGGGNSAAIDAYYLSNIASSVKLVHRSSTLRAENALVEKLKDNGVELFYNSKIQRFNGDERLVSAELYNKKTRKNIEIAVDGVFVQIGSVPNSGLAKKSGLMLDEQGYIVVDSRQRTNVEGVFAAGDVATTPYRQCGTAVGSAIVAAIEAYGYVENPYYYKA